MEGELKQRKVWEEKSQGFALAMFFLLFLLPYHPRTQSAWSP